MEQIYDNCCGVDVHKKLIVACFKHGRKQEVREFGTTTRELLEMAGWLTEGGCEKVAIGVLSLSLGVLDVAAALSAFTTSRFWLANAFV